MKKFFSKAKIALLIAFLMVFGLTATACDDLPLVGFVGTFQADQLPYNVTISSKGLNLSVDCSFKLDFLCNDEDDSNSDNYIFNADLTKENLSLKQFCFVSLMDAHDFCAVIFDGMNPNKDEKDNKSFLSEIGFTNIVTERITSRNSVYDNDTINIVLSTCKLADGSKFVNVSLCTSIDEKEWLSDFDFGADTSDYEERNHTEWVNKDNHKGFEVTANRVMNFLNDYLQDFLAYSGRSDIVIALSGYSRGAAVANLVAQKLIDKKEQNENLFNKIKITAYTFATPNTTTSTDAHNAKYNVIKNYINEDDVVPALLSLNSDANGFKRYGVDYSFSVQKDSLTNGTYKNKYDELAFLNCKTDEEKSSFKNYDASCAKDLKDALNSIISNRDEIYNKNNKKQLTHTKEYKSEDIYVDEEYFNDPTGYFLKYCYTEPTEEQKEKANKKIFEEIDADKINKLKESDSLISNCISETFKYDYEIIPKDPDEGWYVVSYTVTWTCDVYDTLLLVAFPRMMAELTKGTYGNSDLALQYLMLCGFTRHSTGMEKVKQILANNPDYLMQAHSPLGYFINCFSNCFGE